MGKGKAKAVKVKKVEETEMGKNLKVVIPMLPPGGRSAALQEVLAKSIPIRMMIVIQSGLRLSCLVLLDLLC